MVKGKKRKGRRASLLTKAINIGVLALAFSPALKNIMDGKWGELARGYSGGLVKNPQSGFGDGEFDQATVLSWYGPILAAVVLKKAISLVRKTARV